LVYSKPVDSNVVRVRPGSRVPARKEIKEEIYRREIDLGARQARTLEFLQYNTRSEEISHDSDPSHWKQFEKDEGTEADNAIALKYAKEGNDSVLKPAP
jgi:hypothetical protein